MKYQVPRTPRGEPMPSLRVTQFRVLNYRNIDDSGWIPIERVTALVGRNESGKTALLKALHKFNPAIPEPYLPQREFPRDRFAREFKNGKDWPVCQVEFEVDDALRAQRSEEHTSELQSRGHLVCRLLLEKKKNKLKIAPTSTNKKTPTTHDRIMTLCDKCNTAVRFTITNARYSYQYIVPHHSM